MGLAHGVLGIGRVDFCGAQLIRVEIITTTKFIDARTAFPPCGLPPSVGSNRPCLGRGLLGCDIEESLGVRCIGTSL